MKINEIKELHKKTNEELFVLLKDIKKEIEKAYLEHSMKKLKNTNFINEKKKDIARILTVLKEKEDEEKISKQI